jgi:hypothetical protein
MEKKFSVGDVFGYGFRTFIDHLGLLLLGLLACIGLYLSFWIFFASFVAFVFFASEATTIMNVFVWGKVNVTTLTSIPLPVFVVYTIGLLFFMFLFWGLQAGFINLMFKIHDTGEGSIGDLFTRFYLAPRLWGAACLFGLIFMGGLLLLIIPGIYWGVRFSLFPYFIVDQETSIMDSLRKSYVTTAHYEWHMLAIFLILSLLSAIPVVGSTLFFFMSPLVLVYTYRTLTAQIPIIPPTISA